jgi:hypothetical protein
MNSFVGVRFSWLVIPYTRCHHEDRFTGRQRIKLSTCCGYTEIHECIISKVVSKNIELYGPGEEIETTRFILMAADLQ